MLICSTLDRFFLPYYLFISSKKFIQSCNWNIFYVHIFSSWVLFSVLLCQWGLLQHNCDTFFLWIIFNFSWDPEWICISWEMISTLLWLFLWISLVVSMLHNLRLSIVQNFSLCNRYWSLFSISRVELLSEYLFIWSLLTLLRLSARYQQRESRFTFWGIWYLNFFRIFYTLFQYTLCDD